MHNYIIFRLDDIFMGLQHSNLRQNKDFKEPYIRQNTSPNENFEYEPLHEISNSVVCATCIGSDQPENMRSLIRAFACLNILYEY